MIPFLLSEKTSAEVHLDAPLTSTIHIPLNPMRAILRLLSFVVMAAGALFALVSVALHFYDAVPASRLGLPSGMLGDPVSWVRILQMLITASTLVFAVLSALRVIALMQSREAGLVVGPRGVTVACNLRHPHGQLVPWQSIAAIEPIRLQGVAAIKLRLRAADDANRGHGLFEWRPKSRIIIQTPMLRIAHADLKAVLDRYFAEYAVPHPSSQEES